MIKHSIESIYICGSRYETSKKTIIQTIKTKLLIFYPFLLADRVKLRSEDYSFDVIDFGVPG